jgi:hypothetical protein
MIRHLQIIGIAARPLRWRDRNSLRSFIRFNGVPDGTFHACLPIQQILFSMVCSVQHISSRAPLSDPYDTKK